jgi:L-ascorbate metabolism protein UlaG (beta-lactamase superfamily)
VRTRAPWYAAAIALLLAGCFAVPVARHASYHPADADVSVTRIVHGSLIIEMAGSRVVVDPWFHSGLLARQTEPLGFKPDALPPCSAVVLTHSHRGHFDARALRELAATIPEVVAPPALHDRLVELGFRRVTALAWWEHAVIGLIDVTAVPARHAVPENGYVFGAGGTTAYVAGDTRDFPELVDIATAFPALDVALLPIGGERLLGFRREMTPEDAAHAATVLAPRRIVPIGYGARGGFPFFWYASNPLARFQKALAAGGIDASRVVILEPGESWHYYRGQS